MRRPQFSGDPLHVPEHIATALNSYDSDLATLYRQRWSSIRTYQRRGKVQSVFNLRMEDTRIQSMLPQLWGIFQRQHSAFRVNASFGYILRQRLDGTLRYFHSSMNNARLLDSPPFIHNRKDYEEFIAQLHNGDMLEWARARRPDTSYIVEHVTNLTIFVNHIHDHAIGHGGKIILPEWHLKKNGITSVHGNVAQEGLCFFEALAFHKDSSLLDYFRKQNRKITAAKTYLQQWLEGQGGSVSLDNFQGVRLSDLDDLEMFFNVDINVYRLECKGGKYIATAERRSLGTRQGPALMLDIYENHFSYIHDFSMYACSFACGICGQVWKSSYKCKRHENTCDLVQKTKYKSGVYNLQMTIFDELERVGICVPQELRFFPYRATYDFECMLCESNLASMDQLHIPVSFSISSNVPGHTETICIVSEGDAEQLVGKFLCHLESIADTSSELLLAKYKTYLEDLEARATQEQALERQYFAGQPTSNGAKKNNLTILSEKFKLWIEQLVVIGFNSQKYDLNVIKLHLMKFFKAGGAQGIALDHDLDDSGTAPSMALEEEVDTQHAAHRRLLYVVKKTNAFMCIATPKLKFLDITSYMAPGCSYSQYLAAYDVPEQKGYFPYEYLNSLDKLDATALPPYEAFYSTLKSCNVLDDGLDEEAGRRKHAELQALWTKAGMKTFKDYLVHYNSLDTSLFLIALERHAQFFKDEGIDIFKSSISLPGVALQIFFKDAQAKFHLFGEKHAALHRMITDNIVGGPSLIIHRYHEASKTYIRQDEYGNEAKLCRRIIGEDANSLYLWAMAQQMPTGPVIYREGPDFERQTSTLSYSSQAIQWLKWQEHSTGKKIFHAGNGREVRIGTKHIPVDGFEPSTLKIYQFHGCFYHGCNKCNASGKLHPYHPGETMQDVRQRTQNITDYLEALGYSVFEQWECDWIRDINNNPDIKKFIGAHVNTRSSLSKEPKEVEVIKQVEDGSLFGMLLVDIRTPESLKHKFRDLPPIFKNTQVSREDIGDFMKQYAQENGLLNTPSRMLISSYYGEKILLATPLLRWYLSKGLEITKIHAILEFTPDACFAPIADKVSDARRQGDVDARYAITGQNCKLIGNSGYGKLLTQKKAFTQPHYVDAIGASRLVNRKRFRKLNCLGTEKDDLYEVELAPNKIVEDLPHHIAFMVYQYAKLRLLQLRYDFMDKFLDEADFQLCEIDTDSMYFALAHTSLDAAIRPHMREVYYAEYDQWFPTEACAKHKQEFIDVKTRGEEWVPEACCKQQKQHDLRTPGLFKVEWEGKGIIALCSKTYCCYGDDGSVEKVSSKGIQKKQNNLQAEHYMDVLKTQKRGTGTNRGFKTHPNGSVYTYTQMRAGLSYLYPKRKVLPDGVSTVPLDL